MKVFFFLLSIITSSLTYGFQVTCEGSDVDWDNTMTFTLDPKPQGDLNLSIYRKLDLYSTYCDTPGSCPTREEYIESKEAHSANYTLSSCLTDASQGLVKCYSKTDYSEFTIKKSITSELNWKGEVFFKTSYSMMLIHAQLKNDNPLLFADETANSYMHYNFNNCQIK